MDGSKVSHQSRTWHWSCVAIYFILVLKCCSTQVAEKPKDSNYPDLSAPLEVFVGEITSSSVTLSWKSPPNPADQNVKLFAYTLILTPLTDFGIGSEKEYSLPPSTTTKQVNDLIEGTRYVVQLSAVYGDPKQRINRNNLRKISAPKFTVLIPSPVQQDIPVGDDGVPIDEPDCNCKEEGTMACTRLPGKVICTCNAGYTGTFCEECAPGNFRAGKECKLCPCSNITSTAECEMDSKGQIRCTQCLPGHRGSLCNLCTAGYHKTDDRCLPVSCISLTICAEQKDAPGCEDCPFLEDRFPPTAHRSNSERSIADGTLPLIAVVVTLGILLLVAAMATCYRYWNYRRHQPRIPFWNIELQDDKSDLHSHCQYQHLDAASNKVINAAPEDLTLNGGVAGKPCSAAGLKEAGRLTTDSSLRTYNTMRA